MSIFKRRFKVVAQLVAKGRFQRAVASEDGSGNTNKVSRISTHAPLCKYYTSLFREFCNISGGR